MRAPSFEPVVNGTNNLYTGSCRFRLITKIPQSNGSTTQYHDTYGMAVANVLVSLEVRVVLAFS